MQRIELKKKDGFKGEWSFIIPTESFKKYLNNPQVKRLYLTDIGYYPNAKSHYRERNNGTNENIYFYCLKGEGTIIISNSKFTLKENEAFVIPNNVPHKYYSSDNNPWSILWVHFKGDDVIYYPIDKLKIIHFDNKMSNERMLYFFDLLLHRLRRNYTLGNFVYISNVLSLILSETYNKEKQNEESRTESLITNITRYMTDNISENITLEDISEEFNISKPYISSLFKKNTGYSPINFFIELKIKKAIYLMTTTSLKIYEISNALGYLDQYYFSRIFKKIIGMSPKQYMLGSKKKKLITPLQTIKIKNDD